VFIEGRCNGSTQIVQCTKLAGRHGAATALAIEPQLDDATPCVDVKTHLLHPPRPADRAEAQFLLGGHDNMRIHIRALERAIAEVTSSAGACCRDTREHWIDPMREADVVRDAFAAADAVEVIEQHRRPRVTAMNDYCREIEAEKPRELTRRHRGKVSFADGADESRKN
jgi:hypothetical protein